MLASRFGLSYCYDNPEFAMTTQPIRINARLTGDDARRFKELQKLDKRSSSELLREAVREYHVRHVKPCKNAWQIMTESGFIGCGDGPADLSTNTRKYMDEALAEKYPQHFKDDKD